jgi:predicted ArsR family transcriptional regulator
MSELFTAAEYAILTHLKVEGRGTIPELAADLLLSLGEAEQTLANLSAKGFVRKEAEVYLPNPSVMEMPFVRIKQGGTGRMALEHCRPAPAAAAAPLPDVSSIFKQARERAKVQRQSGNGI